MRRLGRGWMVLALALTALSAGCAKRQMVDQAVLAPDGRTARVGKLDYGPDAFGVFAQEAGCDKVLRELAPPKRDAVKSGFETLAGTAQGGMPGDNGASLAAGAVAGVIVGTVTALLPEPKGSLSKAVQAYNDCQQARAQRADTKR